MDRFKPWLEAMYFFCSSELYHLDRLKSYIAGNPSQREFIQEKFQQILDERPLSAEDWENEMNFSHENDDELYEFLGALYQFLFANGAYPEWD
ncbi:hypothetical protein [uncultured Tateyamaria sp.]|uniref:hypothetical protein n=1 Tax=uncultured Tateyamaria sp. TaxID=455651 RepID=UPI0026307943|nr:hypothetical protein [uncultured Tateyamaria sp.]